jgi:diaminopimelate epimerase
MATDFYKYHALGNDYIVIDPNKVKLLLDKKAIKLICDRNFGVGSDGNMLGGAIDIEIKGDRVFMTGSVSAVAKGKFAADFRDQIFSWFFV